jgi:hypothetical protein
MTTPHTNENRARYHRIRSLTFKGGFLDGSRLAFDDGLNCIIGGRGTGETTVIEATSGRRPSCRYSALRPGRPERRFSDPAVPRSRRTPAG